MKQLYSVRVGSLYYSSHFMAGERDDDAGITFESDEWTFVGGIQDSARERKRLMKPILKTLEGLGIEAELVYFPEGNAY